MVVTQQCVEKSETDNSPGNGNRQCVAVPSRRALSMRESDKPVIEMIAKPALPPFGGLVVRVT